MHRHKDKTTESEYNISATRYVHWTTNSVRAYNAVAVLVHCVNLVNPHQMITEVQCLKVTLLTKQNDHRTTSPVQTLAK